MTKKEKMQKILERKEREIVSAESDYSYIKDLFENKKAGFYKCEDCSKKSVVIHKDKPVSFCLDCSYMIWEF